MSEKIGFSDTASKIRKTTQQGTLVDLEIHKSPTHIAGVVAHWGEIYQADDLRERISSAHQIPIKDLPTTTGFTKIYHQRDNISRPDGISDELEVAQMVANKTLEANNWSVNDVDAFVLGSGAPIADDVRYRDYGSTLAGKLGLRSGIPIHNTYAACASGAHELINALKNPDLQGKRVLALAVEGVTTLTPDFDPVRSDQLSMQVFSNGAAGIGVIPGVDMQLLHSKHDVQVDSGALAVHMTYEDLINTDDGIWQDSGNTSMMVMPRPSGERLLDMKGTATTIFFARRGVDFISSVYKEYLSKYPDQIPAFAASHHASKGVNDLIANKLRDMGVPVEMPWMVSDGNSSAATTLIALIRLLERGDDSVRAMLLGYGAGATFDGGVIEFRDRNS